MLRLNVLPLTVAVPRLSIPPPLAMAELLVNVCRSPLASPAGIDRQRSNAAAQRGRVAGECAVAHRRRPVLNVDAATHEPGGVAGEGAVAHRQRSVVNSHKKAGSSSPSLPVTTVFPPGEAANRHMVRFEADGKLTVLTDRFLAKRYNTLTLRATLQALPRPSTRSATDNCVPVLAGRRWPAHLLRRYSGNADLTATRLRISGARRQVSQLIQRRPYLRPQG